MSVFAVFTLTDEEVNCIVVFLFKLYEVPLVHRLLILWFVLAHFLFFLIEDKLLLALPKGWDERYLRHI